MNSIPLLSAPFSVLLRWTALLVLGWLANWLVRHRDARWRLILWRSVLGFGLVLALVPLPASPGLKVSLPHEFAITATQVGDQAPMGGAATSPNQVSLGDRLMLVWAIGFALAMARLIRAQLRLARLQREASLPPPALRERVAATQLTLGVRRPVRLLVSNAVNSPFVCGLFHPTILLPRKLTEDLTPAELAALLRHELAHLRGHDVLWSFGWRGMAAIHWYHPLVWRIPAAHNLCCEQEADRIASGDPPQEKAAYGQMLAHLALRVLTPAAAESPLILNGAAQITRRLDYLRLARIGTWTRRHTAQAVGLMGGMLLLVGSAGFSQSRAQDVGRPTDDLLQVNDMIQIAVGNEPDLQRRIRVSAEYRLVLPLIGVVDVRDMTLSQAAEEIRRRYIEQNFLVNPHVTLSLPEHGTASSEAYGTRLSKLESQLETEKLRLALLRTRYRDSHPKVVAELKALATVQSQIAKATADH